MTPIEQAIAAMEAAHIVGGQQAIDEAVAALKAHQQAAQDVELPEAFDVHYVRENGKIVSQVNLYDEDSVRAAIEAHQARLAVPQGLIIDVLGCDIQARPLRYPLRDYHEAPSGGPLHATWQDKPHRVLYDLVAALKLAAAPTPETTRPTQADPFTYIIQHLNSNPHRLTKDECVALIKELRDLYGQPTQAACIACGKASGHESWCARQRWGIGQTTQAEAPNQLADYHREQYEHAHAGWEACKQECDRLRDELDALATHPAPEQVELDGIVSDAMRRYLRVCSSGGMPIKQIKTVQANVDEAERLGYFKQAIAKAIRAAREAQATKGGEAA